MISPYKPIDEIKQEVEKQQETKKVFSILTNAISDNSINSEGIKINTTLPEIIANRQKYETDKVSAPTSIDFMSPFYNGLTVVVVGTVTFTVIYE